jgi:hypothetical protein
MKTALLSFSLLLIVNFSFAQQNKLIKILKLFPLDEWSNSGDDISPDSLIAQALDPKSSCCRIDTIKNVASFDETSFVLYTAKDGKDILAHFSTIARWMSVTNFWQYDPAKDSLIKLDNYLLKKIPSIRSFFPKIFSFKGKDTTDEIQVSVLPEKDTLFCSLSCEPMSLHRWLYETDNPVYEWIAVWNGVYFVWQRRKAEE